MDVTNTSLLRRIQDPADAQSWSEFYTIYEPLLLRYVRSKGLDENDARDIVAEIFVKLYHAMPGFQLDHSRGRFRTWLWRITCNAITDWRRARKHQQLDSSFDVEQEQDGAPDPQFILEHMRRILEVTLLQVRQEIEPSRPATWACYEQHVIRGRPAAQVARELNLTANNVYVHASRVHKRIRQICRERFEEEIGDDSALSNDLEERP